MTEELRTKLAALLASAMHQVPEYTDVAVLDEPGEELSIGFTSDNEDFFVELVVEHA